MTSSGGAISAAGKVDPRVRDKLREQLDFMKRSARDYDAGHQAEALRLANAMRMLFHDTVHRKSGKPLTQSVLSQLGMQDCTILATPRTKKWADWQDFLAIQLDINSSTPVTFLPASIYRSSRFLARLGGSRSP